MLVVEKEDGDTADDLLFRTFLTIQFPVLGPAIKEMKTDSQSILISFELLSA